MRIGNVLCLWLIYYSVIFSFYTVYMLKTIVPLKHFKTVVAKFHQDLIYSNN